ncbi:MAG: TrkA family potassium uptake protein [Peptoclostridium sp.]|nr:TrkA family potassium uptake protein [Peptoclostridium sp.]
MHIMIVGGHSKVHFLVKKFIAEGHKLIVLHKDEEECKRLAKIHKASIVHGDGTDPAVLEDAGVVGCNVVIAISNSDAENLIVCQVAGKIYGVERTLAVVNDPEHVEVFKKLGVHAVISTADIIFGVIDQEVSVDEIISLMPIEAGKIDIMDIEIGSDFIAAGKSIIELDMPEDSVIGFIVRGEIQMVPKENTIIREGDRLIILSLRSVQPALIEAIRGRAD